MGKAYFNFDCGDKPSNARGSKAEALTYWMNLTRNYADRMTVLRQFCTNFKLRLEGPPVAKATKEEMKVIEARSRRKRCYPKYCGDVK